MEVNPLTILDAKGLMRNIAMFKNVNTHGTVILQHEDAMVNDAQPQSANDFERHLLASPNSSFLWIKFMEFQIALTEVDRARHIAEVYTVLFDTCLF